MKIEQNLVDIIKSFHGTWVTKNPQMAAKFSKNKEKELKSLQGDREKKLKEIQ